MNEPAAVVVLREVLVSQYGELKRRLTQRFGSEDLAGEVLQETYLHLDRPVRLATVVNAKQYLLTVALNIARMRFRRDRRWTSLTALDEALGYVDDAPDPLRTLAAREEFEALRLAFDGLTPRRRRILFASRVEGLRLRDIADELGLTQRAVEKELKAALIHCASKLNRKVVQRFGPGSSKASREGGGAAAVSDADDGQT